ncbi:GNAT family N-acetyltransferase [Curtobacterium sp. RHCJP20]|uniref:GNAT family N-acetyltransferase n=1 Tax=Curtobacterium subtropicum TaxID=3055138 RepID=A0ABT7TFZ1_9MICO|nr:GNAT family N-acetyltransferase [Curtobacterium subtropicum]MDM7887789.1 GNAT family N-acetyltransferase [Curtobacterium subtropicum]
MELVAPSPEYFPSFRRALQEWGGAHQDGAGIRDAAALQDRAGFEHWVEQLLAEETVPASPGHVTCTYRWIVEGDEYLGSIALRHELNDFLRAYGGHVGYGVRPSARGRGLASAALAQVVELAAERGLPEVMLTCDATNPASRRVIEHAGGRYERSVVDPDGHTLLHHWIRTNAHAHPDVTEVDIVGGPEPLTVGLQDHDPAWSARYEEHRARIARALDGQHVTIEHIGSTSVPGLAAKPIVDVAVAVADVTDEAAYLAPLLDAGYELRVREPGHRLVRTPERDAHVHVYEHGAPELDDYLLLRDQLRRDDTDRQRYEDTKRALMEQSWEDTNAYADAKSAVIAAIKDRARAAAVRVRPVRSTDAEAWQDLYAGYRTFYRLPEDPAAVRTTWDWVSTGAHGLSGLVAEDADGHLLGFADLRRFARPSSATTGLYLDDLFTAPDARGRGVATALLHEAATTAAAEGASVVRWITAEDNATARAVYDRVAAATPWVTYDMRPSAD